jgi:hypothetical protein
MDTPERSWRSGPARTLRLGRTDLCERSLTRSLRVTLEQLAEQICRARRLSIELLRSPSRARHLAAVRADLVSQAIEQRVASLSQAARFLNGGDKPQTMLPAPLFIILLLLMFFLVVYLPMHLLFENDVARSLRFNAK